jgi:SAM-dependent methyltransferase
VQSRNSPRQFDYILGDSTQEARRLECQAGLWDPVTSRLLDRIGLDAGWRVLEIGPGRGSVHAELRRRVNGPVDAVERSASFAEAVMIAARADGLGIGRIWQTDLLTAPLPTETYDLIFARWVFCFLPDLATHVKKLATTLRSGGLFVVQDYAHRESFALFPRPVEWLDFLEADRAFFATQGGDISVAGQLPGVFEDAGLVLTSAHATRLSGPPGSLVWEWLLGYFESVRDRLATIPPLDEDKTRRLHDAWRLAATTAHAEISAPTMMDLVARKPLA